MGCPEYVHLHSLKWDGLAVVNVRSVLLLSGLIQGWDYGLDTLIEVVGGRGYS